MEKIREHFTLFCIGEAHEILDDMFPGGGHELIIRIVSPKCTFRAHQKPELVQGTKRNWRSALTDVLREELER